MTKTRKALCARDSLAPVGSIIMWRVYLWTTNLIIFLETILLTICFFPSCSAECLSLLFPLMQKICSNHRWRHVLHGHTTTLSQPLKCFLSVHLIYIAQGGRLLLTIRVKKHAHQNVKASQCFPWRRLCYCDFQQWLERIGIYVWIFRMLL